MSNTDTPNERATIGGNMPPLPKLIFAENESFGAMVKAYLDDEYGEFRTTALALAAEADALPTEVADEDTAGKYTDLLSRISQAAARVEKTRVAEGNPYLTATGVVNAFHFGIIDFLKRRDKKNKPGLFDRLYTALDDYNQRKLAAEQEKRRLAAAEADRIAREAAAAEAERLRVAEETRLAAERARAPAKVEQKTAVANEAEKAASAATVESQIAAGKATEAYIDTKAKPADMMRTRYDGAMNTMQTEPYAIVDDEKLLDKELLWPFISLAVKEQALRAYAKNTGYTVQMAGASIGKRPKTVVRR